ncbi:MFS transporter [Bacillus salacetis]|uniref:MFS transporter n=1 Tax=Bacillus salacetis TaxID=2315464 RepID=A0A3A1QTZ6_9BACI|nr:MFS transporter [Bacillus salacetis]RIW31363.1 MFS transporter [Bacillus salacetis]
MTKDIKVTLSSAFLLNFAGFAVFSFLAVYLSNTLHLSAVESGTVLSILTLSSRLLPFITGSIGDKYGFKRAMGIGLILRGLGFTALAFSSNFLSVSLSAFFIGIGAAFYEPSALAYFSNEKNLDLRKKHFIYLNLALNGGAIIGPLLGGVLLLIDPRVPFLISAFIFFMLYIVQFITLSNANKEERQDNVSFIKGFRQVARNKSFLLFCLSMTFFWFMFAQLTVGIPLHIYNLTNNEGFVSLVITINALTGLILMYFLKNHFIRTSHYTLLITGKITMITSLFLMGIYSNSYWVFFCVIIFTIGETFVLPSSDIAVGDFIEKRYHGTFYGFFDLSFAIGATIGNYSGVLLLQRFPNSFIPWLIFSSIGAIGFFTLRLLLERKKVITINEDSIKV